MNSQAESTDSNSSAVVEEPTSEARALPGGRKNRARRIGFVAAALSVALAVASYVYFGGTSEPPAFVAPKPAEESSSPAATGPSKPLKTLSDEQLERMVAQSSLQIEKEPKNVSAWAMLAHSYEMLGKFAESAKTYAKLAELLPNDAQVLADYADVLAVANGRSFKGEPFGLIKRALAVDPKNAKALLLAGSAYIEEQDHVQALAYLERARSASTDPAFLRQVDETVAQVKALSGASSAAKAAPVQAKPDPGAAGGANAAQVSGRVWLAEDLRDKAPPQATVFVYARPVDGSRMPVALLRKKVSDLPLNFTLDDSTAMVPDMNLSKISKVVVVARVSSRGNVTPAPGDLEGLSAPVSVGAKDLKLEITEVLK